jgi:hypothetical protein
MILAILLVLSLFLSPGSVAERETGVIDIDSVGYLQVQSPVEGARVYLDRIFIGFIQNGVCTIPIDVTATPRYVDLILEYTGYKTYVGPLPDPVAGKTVGVRVEMNRTGYDHSGIILFESGLAGAELSLNGKSMGYTPDSGVLMVHTVPGGLYDVSVSRPGNLTIKKQQYISSNAITTFRVIPEPAPAGEVIINTSPEGAGIYLDNRYEGISPLRLPDVPVGNKTIRIVKEGYQEWISDMAITGGVMNPVDAVLVTLPPSPTPDCQPATSASLLPAGMGENLTPVPGNLILTIGIIIAAALIACIALVFWYVQKKKEE